MLINNAQRAEEYLRRVMGFQQEEFWVLCLSSGLSLIAAQRLFLGTVDRCLVHPRDIFRFAMQENAARILVAHCHPMGSAQPSEQDLIITERIVESGKIVGIPVVDHIILSQTSHASLANLKSPKAPVGCSDSAIGNLAARPDLNWPDPDTGLSC